MRDRCLRVELEKQVQLMWQGLDTPANIENISVGGALLCANLPVDIGDTMEIYLEDESLLDTFAMDGEVIRTGHMRRGLPAFAVKFRDTPDDLRVFLRRAIANRGVIALT